VPHLAVTLGVVLTMLSLGVLIFFIHHVATSIQAPRIIATVASDLEKATTALFPERVGHAETGTAGETDETAFVGSQTGESRTIRASSAGYVQAIDDV
jgi:uncharacterized membrane protein